MDLQLLIVEDNESDAELILRALRRSGYSPRHRRVETEHDFLDALAQGPDIILSDHSMPRFDGYRALQLLQESGRDIPLILVSGTVGEDLAVEAMRRGAADYLLKDRIARLGGAVERALHATRLRVERDTAMLSLRRNEARLRSIIETTADCIFVLSTAGRIQEMNPAGLRNLDARALAEVKDTGFCDYIAEEHRNAFNELHGRVVSGRSDIIAFETIGLRGTRRWHEAQVTPLRDPSARVEAVLAITRDISEHKRDELSMQAQLRELQRWRSITLEREDRVQGLKREVNELLALAGRPPRYPSVDFDRKHEP